MYSGWTCSHLWKAQGASGGPENSGVQWQMSIDLHGAGQWAQGLLEDVGPSVHPQEICFWLSGQRHSHQWPAGGHFVGLWYCSSCSSLHKGAKTGPADGLKTFYDTVQLSQSNCLSHGISSMLGDTANYLAMGHPGGVGLPVQLSSVRSISPHAPVVTLNLAKCKTKMSVTSTC